jgi:hypothetical protein
MKFIKNGLKDESLDEVSDEDLFKLIKAHKKYLELLNAESSQVAAP